jgi:hypothetical protein
LIGTRLLFREPIEKETCPILIGQIAEQEFDIGIRLGHSAHCTKKLIGPIGRIEPIGPISPTALKCRNKAKIPAGAGACAAA